MTRHKLCRQWHEPSAHGHLRISTPTKAVLASLLLGYATASLQAQEIDPSNPPQQGADPTVNYLALAALAPWDDRNYSLTAADLALLSEHEAEAKTPIPAFFRVMLRRAMPDLPKRGPAQYPRSALNRFIQQHRGYLVGGQYHRNLNYRQGRFELELSNPLTVTAPLGESQAAEQRVTSPTGAQEAAVAIHPNDSQWIIAGTNGPGDGQAMHYSNDAGRTWLAAELPSGDTCCDPAVAWSADGQYAYAVSLRMSEWHILFYRSSDKGRSWDDLISLPPGTARREIGQGADKEYLHVDQHADSPYRDRLYLSWHEGTRMRVAYSADFGDSWQTVKLDKYVRGLGSDLATDSAGRVYHAWATLADRRIVLLRSDDGGVTWGSEQTVAATEAAFIFPIPSTETRQVLVSPSIDVDISAGPYHDSVYLAWTDTAAPPSATPNANRAQVQVAYSRDLGETWQTVTPHANDGRNDRWHPWLKVDDTGIVHLVYYDTADDPSRRSVHAYYTYSTDGGVSFQPASRLTTVPSPNVSHSLEFGDYNGLDVRDGRVVAIFTDNRDEACSGSESVDVYVSSPDLLRNFECERAFGNGFE